MAYGIEPGEAPGDALCRIAHEQVGRALDEIDDSDLDLHATVHQVRKRCKKVRGLVRLVRPAFPGYSAENAWFRDAARELSDLRDATSLIESLDALAERFEGDADFGELRAALESRREEHEAEEGAGERLGRVRDALAAVAGRVGDWKIEADGFDAIGGGFEKVYRRARKGREAALAQPSAETLHEWRKRVKYHRYHLRLLRTLWPAVVGPCRDEAKLLSDRLGDDHDLAVLRATLVREADRFRAVDLEAPLALVDTRRKELQAWSQPLGQRLLAEKPKRLRKRFARYWQARAVERRLAGVLPDGSAAVS